MFQQLTNDGHFSLEKLYAFFIVGVRIRDFPFRSMRLTQLVHQYFLLFLWQHLRSLGLLHSFTVATVFISVSSLSRLCWRKTSFVCNCSSHFWVVMIKWEYPAAVVLLSFFYRFEFAPPNQTCFWLSNNEDFWKQRKLDSFQRYTFCWSKLECCKMQFVTKKDGQIAREIVDNLR